MSLNPELEKEMAGKKYWFVLAEAPGGNSLKAIGHTPDLGDRTRFEGILYDAMHPHYRTPEQYPQYAEDYMNSVVRPAAGLEPLVKETQPSVRMIIFNSWITAEDITDYVLAAAKRE